MKNPSPYQPVHTVRIVTAASLFDGHDAAINIMRRIIQATGCEVIHLGHNRSVAEVVDAAIQEDAHAIAMTSYQGGHVEYFKYMLDLLHEKLAGHIKVFGGGGGTILPSELDELHKYGIARLYSPDDGREMGLQGMINDVVQQADVELPDVFGNKLEEEVMAGNALAIAQAVTATEHKNTQKFAFAKNAKRSPVLGITGTGGAGKSSLTDEFVRRFMHDFPEKKIAILSIDPSKRRTGGALLGDRIRMNSVHHPNVYMRSFATRAAHVAINEAVHDSLRVLSFAGFDLIIVETAGIGQSDSQIVDVADVSLYVMTPEYGAASQLEKIDMIDYADIVALNKFDKRGADDALRDVRKQYQRSRLLFDQSPDSMPVYGTIASQFNDHGTNVLYSAIIQKINEKCSVKWKTGILPEYEQSEKIYIIPPDRMRYLAEIAEESDRYQHYVDKQSSTAQQLWQITGTIDFLKNS